ncbi:proline-rich protein 2-like [Chiroxiphia lanceolata]|uniref:proline-rich protein 2-like n=1 Tax=Chiroxiphia lanceolata TaxID=296741 RepID=UPI0013CF1D3B|nr:proline-rich protein 2-like [Chiroxiphia lanceolata]
MGSVRLSVPRPAQLRYLRPMERDQEVPPAAPCGEGTRGRPGRGGRGEAPPPHPPPVGGAVGCGSCAPRCPRGAPGPGGAATAPPRGSPGSAHRPLNPGTEPLGRPLGVLSPCTRDGAPQLGGLAVPPGLHRLERHRALPGERWGSRGTPRTDGERWAQAPPTPIDVGRWAQAPPTPMGKSERPLPQPPLLPPPVLLSPFTPSSSSSLRSRSGHRELRVPVPVPSVFPARGRLRILHRPGPGEPQDHSALSPLSPLSPQPDPALPVFPGSARLGSARLEPQQRPWQRPEERGEEKQPGQIAEPSAPQLSRSPR